MGNGANKLFNLMGKSANKNNPTSLVTLTVKSINPLEFKVDDNLVITEEFYLLDNPTGTFQLNQQVNAIVLNQGQLYYIFNKIEIDFPVPKWGDIEGTLANQLDLKQQLNNKANTNDLSDVATSGDYNDLDNKPSIPTWKVIDNIETQEDHHTNAPSINAVEQWVKNKLIWNLLGEHSNTSDEMTTTQITISNIDKYSEFLLTAANDTSTNRVLASSIIPKEIFAGVSGNGHHQAIYRGDSLFGSGVSFNSTTNVITLYARAHSATRLYAR